jgi:hypothetical protein
MSVPCLTMLANSCVVTTALGETLLPAPLDLGAGSDVFA